MSEDPLTQPYRHHLTMQAIEDHICSIEAENGETESPENIAVFGHLVIYDPSSNETRIDLDQLASTAAQIKIAPETLLRDLVWLADILLPIEDALQFHRDCALWLAEDDPTRTRASIFKAYLAVARKDRVELGENCRKTSL